MNMKKIINRIKNRVLDILFLNKLAYALVVLAIYIRPRIDKLMGRYYANKVRNKGIDFRIHGAATILSADSLKVGDYVRIGKHAHLNCAGGLHIGNNCQISTHFTVHTSSHNIESGAIPYDKSFVYNPVSIGDSVWIGKHCTITPGVKIGEGAIIGANTVVSNDVPPFAIVVGAKHRIVGYRNKEKYLAHKENKAYFGKLFPDS